MIDFTPTLEELKLAGLYIIGAVIFFLLVIFSSAIYLNPGKNKIKVIIKELEQLFDTF